MSHFRIIQESIAECQEENAGFFAGFWLKTEIIFSKLLRASISGTYGSIIALQ